MQLDLFTIEAPTDFRLRVGDVCPDCGDTDNFLSSNHGWTAFPGWCGKRLFLTQRARGHVSKPAEIPDFIWLDLEWLKAHGYELEDRFGEAPTIPFPERGN
jgi:hypothetical protein